MLLYTTGSETHFKVVVISDNFEGMPLIKVRKDSQCKSFCIFKSKITVDFILLTPWVTKIKLCE